MSKPFCLLSGLTALVVAVAIYGSSPSVLPSSQGRNLPVPPATAEATNGSRVAQQPIELHQGLAMLPYLNRARSRSVCAENPTGARGKGGMAVPNPSDPTPAASARAADDLGQGWKVRPFLRVNRGQTATLMDVDGPGLIEHIWMVEGLSREHPSLLLGRRDNALDRSSCPRLLCGGPRQVRYGQLAGRGGQPEQRPELLLADALPQACPCNPQQRVARPGSDVASLPDRLRGNGGCSQCRLFPCPVPAGPHGPAEPLRDPRRNPRQGRYVGTFLAWTQCSQGWFGEGEIKFYIDGDKEFPTICGTGTEDYFCGSYGFPRPFSGPYTGTTLLANENAPPPNFWSLYRWHIMDPICFQQDLRVTIQALGWQGSKYKKLSDDVASVAYWYQTFPHAPFPPLPPLRIAWPKYCRTRRKSQRRSRARIASAEAVAILRPDSVPFRRIWNVKGEAPTGELPRAGPCA